LLRKNSRSILIALGIFSVIVFIGIARHTVEMESIPRPISKTNIPKQFTIIAITDSGIPVLLEHEIGLHNKFKYYRLEKMVSNEYRLKILWQKDCVDSKKYSFYIDAKKKESIERTLTAYLYDKTQIITIELLENHPSQKKQRIRINFWNDGDRYYSEYTVDNRSVTHFLYGDTTTGDTYKGVFVGFIYMVAVFVFGRMVFAAAVWCESKNQEQI